MCSFAQSFGLEIHPPSEVAKLSTISVNPPEDLAGSSEAEVW